MTKAFIVLAVVNLAMGTLMAFPLATVSRESEVAMHMLMKLARHGRERSRRPDPPSNPRTMNFKPTSDPGRAVVELGPHEPQLPTAPLGEAPAPPVFKLRKILVPVDFMSRY